MAPISQQPCCSLSLTSHFYASSADYLDDMDFGKLSQSITIFHWTSNVRLFSGNDNYGEYFTIGFVALIFCTTLIIISHLWSRRRNSSREGRVV